MGMDLNPSEEQRTFVTAVQAVMDREAARGWRITSTSSERSLGDALWQTCAELGWLGLGLSETVGGAGLGIPDEVLLFREVGRHLMPGPLHATVIGGHVAAQADRDDLANALVDGTTRAGWGVGDHAIDAHPGDLLVRIDGGDVSLEQLSDATPASCVDASLRLSRIGSTEFVVRVTAPALVARARLIVSAQLLGIAEAVRDQSAEYATQRMQFGKPIGVNQAIKHRCADQVIRCWAARAQLFLSALLLEGEQPESELNVASTVVLVTEAARLNVAANVHIHGGVGMTAEHRAGNYVKRAHVLERSLPDARAITAKLLEAPGLLAGADRQ